MAKLNTLKFNPSGYINNNCWLWGCWNDTQWVGTDEAGVKILNSIEEHQTGPIDKQYLGVIFDCIGGRYTQLGFAATKIQAVISVSDEVPPADFKANFNKVEALKFAYLSQLAYSEYSEVKEQLRYGLKAKMEIKKECSTANTVGFIASDDTSVVVAFRGTVLTEYRNLLTDAWFTKRPIFSGSPVEAHSGFVTALELVYSDISKFLKSHIQGKKLYITGHSLGAALASLLGYRLVQERVINSSPILYVYGCPPVGEPSFATSYSTNPCNTITIPDDPISSGILISVSRLQNLFKPVKVKYLATEGGHLIASYIDQLEKLQSPFDSGKTLVFCTTGPKRYLNSSPGEKSRSKSVYLEESMDYNRHPGCHWISCKQSCDPHQGTYHLKTVSDSTNKRFLDSKASAHRDESIYLKDDSAGDGSYWTPIKFADGVYGLQSLDGKKHSMIMSSDPKAKSKDSVYLHKCDGLSRTHYSWKVGVSYYTKLEVEHIIKGIYPDATKKNFHFFEKKFGSLDYHLLLSIWNSTCSGSTSEDNSLVFARNVFSKANRHGFEYMYCGIMFGRFRHSKEYEYAINFTVDPFGNLILFDPKYGREIGHSVYTPYSYML